MMKQGKSRYARKLIVSNNLDQFGCLVFDVNDEYGQFREDRETGKIMPSTNLPTDTNLPRSRYIGGDFNEFLAIADNKKHTTIIFEEATSFFMGATGQKVRSLVTRQGHSKNNYVFIFHSIRTIPPTLLGLMHYVVLFKTNDDEDTVKKRDPKLLPFWFQLQYKEDGAKPYSLNWLEMKPFDKKAFEVLKNSKIK